METTLRSFFLILPAIALAACSTPRESCIYRANDQLRALENRIDVAQGNVDRGYAVAEFTTTRVIEATCSDRLEDGTIETYECDRTETITSSEPVPIDLAEERRKLADLKRQLPGLRDATQAAEQQCIAIHPE